MAMTTYKPNKIRLHGETDHVENAYVAGVAITPGMLVEMYNVGGSNRWRPCSSATNVITLAVALNQLFENKTVDDPYAVGDLVAAWFLEPGCEFWGILPSGQNIANGDYLQSNGDGKLKAATSSAASAGVARLQSLEAIGAVTADTRVRVQVI